MKYAFFIYIKEDRTWVIMSYKIVNNPLGIIWWSKNEFNCLLVGNGVLKKFLMFYNLTIIHKGQIQPEIEIDKTKPLQGMVRPNLVH